MMPAGSRRFDAERPHPWRHGILRCLEKVKENLCFFRLDPGGMKPAVHALLARFNHCMHGECPGEQCHMATRADQALPVKPCLAGFGKCCTFCGKDFQENFFAIQWLFRT